MKTMMNAGLWHRAKVLLAAAAIYAGGAVASGDEALGAYMVVDLTTGATTYETGSYSKYTDNIYKTTKMVFRKIPAGTYAVQNGNTQANITNDFYIGIYEVTVGQYRLMQDPDTHVPETDANMKPQTSISYNALRGTRDAAVEPTAASTIGTLTSLVRACGGSGLFDLPSEAMWEVAARAMPANDFAHAAWPWFFGTSSSALGDYAWHLGNANGELHVVGLKLPNDWGLYDMYGNVKEWCRDHWSWSDFAPTLAGNTTAIGANRAQRGGSCLGDYDHCSSGVRLNAYYTDSDADYGFRLSMVAVEGSSAGPDQGASLDVNLEEQSAPTQLSGKVCITEWFRIDSTHWRLVFTTPADTLKGETDNLEPDKSFSLKYSNSLSDLNQKESGANCGYADFTIDGVSSAGGMVTVTMTLTIADDGFGQTSSLLVKVVDPYFK